MNERNLEKKKVLIPLPSFDFDPTETAVPWGILRAAGHEVVFATPQGNRAHADRRMLTGEGLGVWRNTLRADQRGRDAYAALERDDAFQNPLPYEKINSMNFDGILLPGGHAKGMREYLESKRLQDVIAEFFHGKKAVGAICHGVVLVARSRCPRTGKSVLYGYRTTALTRFQELAAWNMTRLWMGDYYRTYAQTVEDEVREELACPDDFEKAIRLPVFRDSPDHLDRGFAVRDRHYVSARWPGDAHLFATEFRRVLERHVPRQRELNE
jgi:putative intracellular protease/amidase